MLASAGRPTEAVSGCEVHDCRCAKGCCMQVHRTEGVLFWSRRSLGLWSFLGEKAVGATYGSDLGVPFWLLHWLCLPERLQIAITWLWGCCNICNFSSQSYVHLVHCHYDFECPLNEWYARNSEIWNPVRIFGCHDLFQLQQQNGDKTLYLILSFFLKKKIADMMGIHLLETDIWLLFEYVPSVQYHLLDRPFPLWSVPSFSLSSFQQCIHYHWASLFSFLLSQSMDFSRDLLSAPVGRQDEKTNYRI